MLSGFLVGAVGCSPVSVDEAVPTGEYRVVTHLDQGREHLTTGSPAPNYNSNPPTSGPHAPNTVPCGIHAEPIPDVVVVHNLEHGVVVVHYLPTIPRGELSELMGAVSGLVSHAILAPRPSNPTLVTLSAWTVQLQLASVDVEALRWFWEEYSGQGPEVVDCPMEVGMAG